MSVLIVVFVNAIVAATVVATLVQVCRIPYRLDRAIRPEELPAASGEQRTPEPAYERSAA